MNAITAMTGPATDASGRAGAACTMLLGAGTVRGRPAGASDDEARTQGAESPPETDRLEDVSQSGAFAG